MVFIDGMQVIRNLNYLSKILAGNLGGLLS